jgi:hypothetical protein
MMHVLKLLSIMKTHTYTQTHAHTYTDVAERVRAPLYSGWYWFQFAGDWKQNLINRV